MKNQTKKTILVTGPRGNLGREIIPVLTQSGYEVVGLVREHESIDHPFAFNYREIRSLGAIKESIAQDQLLAVIHLAAENHFATCQNDPYTAFSVNSCLTLDILEAIKDFIQPHFLFFSSAYVYGNINKEAHRSFVETDEAHPESIYASTKFVAEEFVRAYSKKFNFAASILRPTNIFGQYSHPDTIISLAIHRAQNEQKITLLDFTPVRDFIYVKDVVECVRRLILNPPNKCETFNLANGVGMKIKDVAFIVGEIFKIEKQNINQSATFYSNSNLTLSNEKIRNFLDWAPQYSLKEGIKDLIK